MLENDNRKVVLVGTGILGMSYAYALLNQNLCDELVLIDENREKAAGEAMDLRHCLPFSDGNMRIYVGTYEDCQDADLIVVTEAKEYTEESEEGSLLKKLKKMNVLVRQLLKNHFSGIFLIALSPIDLITKFVYQISHFPASRVIGTGTILDTARLRYFLGEMFSVDSKNIHAYVIGEQGDSEFVAWSQAMVATKSVFSICKEEEACSLHKILEIEDEVRLSSHWILEHKKEECYGPGMTLARITKAIFGNQNAILTVSTLLQDKYGERDIFIGVPAVINRSGVKDVLELPLTEEEKEQLSIACNMLRERYEDVLEKMKLEGYFEIFYGKGSENE